jgi:hypothetical protein
MSMTREIDYVRPVVESDGPVQLGDTCEWGVVVDYTLSLTEDERDSFPYDSPCLWWAALPEDDEPAIACRDADPGAPHERMTR